MGRLSLTDLTRRGPRPGGSRRAARRIRESRRSHPKKKHPGCGHARRHSGRRDATGSAAGKAGMKHPYLAITDATGRHLRHLTKFAVTSPNWSPDGRRLVAVAAGEVVLINLQGKLVAKLTRGSSPVFSPDGSKIAFIAAGGECCGRSRPLAGRPRTSARCTPSASSWNLYRASASARRQSTSPMPAPAPLASQVRHR